MIDEGVLTEALSRVADAIDLPQSGAERILAAARPEGDAPEGETSEPEPAPPQIHGSGTIRRRLLLVAASVVVLVCGVTLFAVRADHPPAKPLATSVPSTTAPHVGANGAAPTQSGASANTTFGAAAPTANGAQAASGAATPGQSVAPSLPSGSVGQSPKIEAKGSIQLSIGHGKLQASMATLTSIAAGAGGFVASTQAQSGPGTGNSSSGTVILRVPQSDFTAVLKQVEQVGHVTSLTTSANDVTGQYVDLQARITALQASRQQYLTIMSHATSIGDILAVQSQLDTLQSQIEQLQGQLNVLDSETSYGSLTVALTEAGHRTPPPLHPESGLASAWHAGVNGFVRGFEWLIRVAGPALFVLLVLAALALVGRWGWRVARRRML